MRRLRCKGCLGEARLSPAERHCGFRPEASRRRYDAATRYGLELPDVEAARRWLAPNGTVLCEIQVAGHGPVVMPMRDALSYRSFQLRCAEQLLQAFGRYDAGEWRYRLLRAFYHTIASDEEARP